MQLDNSVKPDDDNSMSELKQILSEALMKKGIFGKIQAELRASIFSIFKEKELKLSFMSQIQRVNDLKSTVEGQLMFNLMLEACDILGLTFSKSVLLSEASLLDVAVSQNALRSQLNLEGEGEKNTPVLLQLLKTLDVQDINLEEYIINEKHSQIDSFEAFKQKQLNINSNDNASSSNSEQIPVIMTSEMKTEKTIDEFKNRNNDILKKLDSIISLDHENNKFDHDYEEESYEDVIGDEDDELIEEVSLLDIQNNSLISNDEILKESKIIEEAEAEAAAAKSLQQQQQQQQQQQIQSEEDPSESILDSLKDEIEEIEKEASEESKDINNNKYKAEEDSEIEFMTEISKEEGGEGEDESEAIEGAMIEKVETESLISDTDDPSELRKQATKSLINDIKLQLENEVIQKPTSENPENPQDDPEKAQKQISIDDLNITKNLR